MNETTTGAPLTATVGERLGDDPHVREVREEVARAAAEPGAQVREGTTSSRGASERRRRASTGARRGGAAARPFPWGALALAAVGWALVTGVGRGIRRRARRVGSGARALALRLVPGR